MGKQHREVKTDVCRQLTILGNGTFGNMEMDLVLQEVSVAWIQLLQDPFRDGVRNPSTLLHHITHGTCELQSTLTRTTASWLVWGIQWSLDSVRLWAMDVLGDCLDVDRGSSLVSKESNERSTKKRMRHYRSQQPISMTPKFYERTIFVHARPITTPGGVTSK